MRAALRGRDLAERQSARLPSGRLLLLAAQLEARSALALNPAGGSLARRALNCLWGRRLRGFCRRIVLLRCGFRCKLRSSCGFAVCLGLAVCGCAFFGNLDGTLIEVLVA